MPLPITWFHYSLYKPHAIHNSLIYSEDGLTLEMSELESLYSDQITLLTLLIKGHKTKHCFSLLTYAVSRADLTVQYVCLLATYEILFLYQKHIIAIAHFLMKPRRLYSISNNKNTSNVTTHGCIIFPWCFRVYLSLVLGNDPISILFIVNVQSNEL